MKQFFVILENFIQDHVGLMTSIGVVLLIAALTLWTTMITNRAATKRLKNEALIAAALKSSNFQLEALNELRRDFVDFLSDLRSWRLGNVPSHEIVTEKFNRVLLQLKRRDPMHEKFIIIAEELMIAPDFPVFDDRYEELKRLCTEILSEGNHSIEIRLKNIGLQ